MTKKVLIVSTGSTISSTSGRDGTLVPTLAGGDLVQMIPEIESVATIDTFEYSRVPSHYLGFSYMLRFSEKIDKSLSSNTYDGVVVTMGTNIIEEAAYCLDLLLDTSRPVVVTGAMRGPSQPSLDASMNLYTSVVAHSPTC